MGFPRSGVSQQGGSLLLEIIGCAKIQHPKNRLPDIRNTTGLRRENIQMLCDMICEHIPEEHRTWPSVLGLYTSIVVTLTYLRRTRIQAEIAELNKQVNKIRSGIVRAIAHFKNWRILHTDYRWPLHTFTNKISAVIALHCCATARISLHGFNLWVTEA